MRRRRKARMLLHDNDNCGLFHDLPHRASVACERSTFCFIFAARKGATILLNASRGRSGVTSSSFVGVKVMRTFPGERFSSSVSLSPKMVSDIAATVGDNNPVHHDPEFAQSTRFKRPIVSGPHTTALLLALTASHFSKTGAMLGLEFWVRFKKAIYADETIKLEWLVVKVTPIRN